MEPANTNEHAEVLRGRDLLELPVYSIAEGKLLGSIDGLLVRREDQTVPWIRFKNGTLGGHRYARFTAFQTIGVDIALVPSEQAVQEALSPDDSRALDLDLRGRSVLTPNGQVIGTLAGFEVDTGSGGIVAIRVKSVGGFFHNMVASLRDDTVAVPRSQIKSIGPDAVMLEPAGAALFGETHPKQPAAQQPG